MRGRAVLLAVLTVLAATATLLVAAPAPPAHAAATRIMALGDSITGSPGCWRALLWNRLQSAGHTNIDMVGTLGPQGCGVPYDGDNEGHGGFLATNVADQNQLVPWLAATRPDIVMMHFGTNDVWNNRSTATILAAFGKLVDQMRASNAGMRIVVAKIIPMNPSNCAECGQRVVDLNNAIPAWAASKSTAQSPITVVDQWTGFSTGTDTNDGVHPNGSGDQKISDRWFPAVVSALGSVPPPPTTTPPPNPGTGCAVDIRVVNSWQGGFVIEIVVRNIGANPMTSWTVAFALRAGMTVASAWNTTVTSVGLDVTASNVNWNNMIPPNGNQTVGMIINGDPTGWTPEPRC